MILGSTAKNINLLTVAVIIAAAVGGFNSEIFTVTNLVITVVCFYTLNIIGIWLMMHRYYSHKSFEFRWQWLEATFTAIAVLAGRGSPLGWVYLHRQHHAYSDTVNDPHSPKYFGFKLFSFEHYRQQEQQPMKIFLVKELMTPVQLFIHKWYMLVVCAFIMVFATVNLELFYFSWVLPAFLIQLSQSLFNYYGHIWGYRNLDTRDNSTNNPLLFPLILGECWHNNHHGDPKNTTTTVRPFEIDPLSFIIKLIKR